MPTACDDHQKLYICPGEAHPISRSVHLARLAAFYPSCRDCPFRTDTGPLPGETVKRLKSTERRAEPPPLFRTEGVRGVYLNQLSRRRVGQIAGALSRVLWSRSPLVGRMDDSGPRAPRALPTVVVGYDERPAAPDLMLGVCAALRRMSCQVIDIGLTTRPGFWYAVDHLQAAAGVFITGGGCDPSWMGLDFAARDGRPVSAGAAPCEATFSLDDIARHADEPDHRPSRRAGTQRRFRASVPYEASLLKHFAALRPLKIACGSASPLVMRTLTKLFAPLPCRLLPVAVPVRARDTADANDADVRRLATAVQSQQADLGLLIDDDGQRCAVFDERGRLAAPWTVTALLAESLRAERPGEPVVLPTDAPPELAALLERRGIAFRPGGRTLAEMSHAMRTEQAALGGGADGRYWFREPLPTCDAVLTLARLLAALSRNEATLSIVIETAAAG
jgi:phosphomannomutase